MFGNGKSGRLWAKKKRPPENRGPLIAFWIEMNSEDEARTRKVGLHDAITIADSGATPME